MHPGLRVLGCWLTSEWLVRFSSIMTVRGFRMMSVFTAQWVLGPQGFPVRKAPKLSIDCNRILSFVQCKAKRWKWQFNESCMRRALALSHRFHYSPSKATGSSVTELFFRRFAFFFFFLVILVHFLAIKKAKTLRFGFHGSRHVCGTLIYMQAKDPYI